MIATLSNEALNDAVAVTTANIVATANRRARELGVHVERTLMTVTHVATPEPDTWRVNYVPEDYLERRGGDLIIDVDARSGAVIQVLRGQ
ncbi:MAG TPA: hypothetical protein VFB96_21695 [Pirellulaceae bacterium]|nr:hypothetical protein [Pirellulaceae bacterium]